MKKVLFVCTGNTCRSSMAQGIFNKLAEEKRLDYKADSAGLMTMTGLDYSENAVKACEKIGVDISGGRSVSVQDVNLNSYDLICPMTVNHAQMLTQLGVDRDKIMLLSSKGISDPYGGDIKVYEKCCLEIKQAIEKLIEKL